MIKNWDEEEESIHLKKQTNEKSWRWPFCSDQTVMLCYVMLCWAIQEYSPRLVRQSSEDHVFVPIPHSVYKQSPSSIFPCRHSTQNIAEKKQNIIKIKDYTPELISEKEITRLPHKTQALSCWNRKDLLFTWSCEADGKLSASCRYDFSAFLQIPLVYLWLINNLSLHFCTF